MATRMVSVLCVFLMMLAIRVDAQSIEEGIESDLDPGDLDLPEASIPDTYWEVEWGETGPLGNVSAGGALEPFAVAGEIIPGFETAALIDVAATSWRSDSLFQAAGEMCRSLGPVASQYLGSGVEKICQPILDSLNTEGAVPELSIICDDIVREIEDQFTADEGGTDGSVDVGSTDHLSGTGDSAGEESAGEESVTRGPGSEGSSPGESEIDFGLEFWYTPDYGYFYPSEFVKEILGFAGNSQTETCKRLGSIVFNRTLTGRDVLQNITSAAVRHLLPLSLQFCDRADNDVQVTFGKVLHQLFSTLIGDQDSICGEPERFNELVTRITDYLLGEFLYNDQKCRDVFSQLETMGIKANLGFDYDSAELMCQSIQQIAYMVETSNDRDDLSEAGREFRRVLRAVGGFLHSGTAKEGFISLCNTFQDSSSPADNAMCAALNGDNSRELIQQCINLCGASDDGSFGPPDFDNDNDGPQYFAPWEEKFDEMFGWVGRLSSAVSRIPGLEDYDLVEITFGVLGYGSSSNIQSACEVTENKLFYSEDVSVRQLVNSVMDEALQKLIYELPSACNWEVHTSESTGSDKYEDSFFTPRDENNFLTADTVTEPNGNGFRRLEEATGIPYSDDAMQPSVVYDKASWFEDSSPQDGSVNFDMLSAALAFFADVESPDALCNKSIEIVSSGNFTKLGQLANKTRDGILKVITDEVTCVRFFSVMGDKFEGGLDLFGELLSGFESTEQLCFVLSSRIDWEDDGRELSTSEPIRDMSMTELPEGPWVDSTREPIRDGGDHYTDSELPKLFSLFGRLIKSPSVRESFEEVCNFFDDDLTDEERESCYALRSDDPEKYFESCLKLETIFFKHGDGADDQSWNSLPDIATYIRFVGEWVQVSINGAAELEQLIKKVKGSMFNGDVPFPDVIDLLIDVLDLQDPNPDAVCERFGHIVHHSNMTVREVAIKMLDSILVSVGRFADNLCFEPGKHYPLYGSSNDESMEESLFEATGSPDSDSDSGRQFTESPSFQSSNKATDDPSWMGSYMEDGGWNQDGKDPFSGRLGGKIFAYLGNFKSPGEICANYDTESSGEFITEEPGSGDGWEHDSGRHDRKDGPIAERVVAMRQKLMSATYKIDVCVGLMEVITSELDIFSGVLPGFTDPYSLCQRIKYSFTSRNRGSMSEFSINDFNNPAEDMGGLLSIGGRLFNSTVKEALQFPCKLLSDTPLALLVASECEALSRPDPSPLMKAQCKSVINQFIGDYHEDQWYVDGYPSSHWNSDKNTSPLGWFGKLIDGNFPIGDLSVLFYDMFGLKNDSPTELCSNAESFVANNSMTMKVIFDIGLDASLRNMIRASPKILCENEGTAVPTTEMPTFDPKGVPSWAESFIENVYLNIPGVDPFDAMNAAFTYIGQYNTSDDFCEDALEALADSAEPALLDELVNRMKVVVYMLIEDAEACEEYLEFIQDELSLPFSIGDNSGHADNPSLCRAVVSAFDPANRSSRVNSTFAELASLSNLAGNMEHSLYTLKTESLNVVGHFYNGGTFQNVVNESCSYLKEMGGNYGQRLGQLCKWATREHDALRFYEICFEIATAQSFDSYSSVDEDSEFDSFGFNGYSKIVEFIVNFGTDIFSVEKTLNFLQEVFGVDVSSPEKVCGSAKKLIANDSLTVPVIFNNTLEVFARHAAQASHWLCRSEIEATDIPTVMPTEAPGFYSSEPYWAESVFESVYWNIPGADPHEFMKVVFSYLNRYNMSDAFCRDTLSAVAEGADPTLLEGLVNKTKDSIYILVKDANSCESFMSVIQESLELPYSIGEVAGLGGNRGFCEGLSVAFGSASGRNVTSGNDEFRLGQLFDFAAQVDSTGGIRKTLRSGCDVLDLLDIVPDEIKTGYSIACAWSRMASNAEIFYHVCLDFVSESFEDEEEDNFDSGLWLNAYVPDWMKGIDGIFDNIIYTHTGTLLWMRETFWLNANTPDRFCETARERIEDESIQIHDVVDSSLETLLRQVMGVYPWMCTLEVEATVEPTATEAPGVVLGDIPPWADSVVERVSNLEIPGVVPEELLGIVLGYLGRYNNSDALCFDSIQAVEYYDTLRYMIDTMKSSLYKLTEDSHSCENFTDVLQESLELSLGNLTGFDSNREFCEAIENAFRPENYEHVSLFALRQFTKGEDLSDDQKPYHELILFLGSIFNTGSLGRALRISCDLFEEANFYPDMFESEAKSACNWIVHGDEPEEFQSGCVTVITTPVDGYSEDNDVFSWIGELFEIFSIENTFYWLQEIFGLDASSPEKVCGSAKELIANESLTVQVIIDTTMDNFIRHAAHASPWLCQGESDVDEETTGAPGFEATDMPSWAEEAMEDIYMRIPGLDPLELAKAVYNFLGRYNSSDELCMNSMEAIAEGADPALLDELVVRVKESLYSIMRDVDSCEHFMDVVHESAGLPFSLASLVGVDSNRELCEAASTVFASEGDSSFGDSVTAKPFEGFHIGKLFDLVGHIDTSGTLKETVRTGCDLLDRLDIVPEELKSGMAVTCAWSRMGSNADIFYAACINYASQAGYEEDGDHTNDSGDSWWPDFNMVEFLRYVMGDLWNDVFSFSYSDMMMWMQSQYGLDVSSPEQVCNNAKYFIGDETLSPAASLDATLDFVIRQVASASPWLCMNEPESTAVPPEEGASEPEATEMPRGSSGFNTEIPPWAYAAYSNVYMDMLGVDPLQLTGDIFSFLGRYDNSEELCRDTLEAVADDAEPALLDDVVNRMKETVYSLMRDAESCESFIDVLEGSLSVPLSLGQLIGFGSNRAICEAAASSFDPEASMNLDLSTLMGDDQNSPDFVLLQIFVRVLNSRNMKDTLQGTCSVLDQFGMIDQFGPEFRVACEWAKMDSSVEIFYYACLDFVRPSFEDQGSSIGPAAQLFSWMVGRSDEFGSNTQMLHWMLNIFGFDVSTQEVCDGINNVFKGELFNIPVIVDTLAEISIRSTAYAMPLLCKDPQDERPGRPIWDHDFTEKPSWYDMEGTGTPGYMEESSSRNGMETDRPGSEYEQEYGRSDEEPDFVGALFTFLGRYDNSRQLCRDSLEAVAVGADPYLLNNMVRTMKETLYNLVNDAGSCNSFIDVIQRSMGIPFSIGQVIGFESNWGYCKAIQDAFDPHIDNDIDFSAFLILLPAELRHGMGRYDEDMGRYSDGMDIYDDELTTEESEGDNSEFTTDSYYLPPSWGGDREDHNPMITPEEHYFVRELVKLSARIFKSGTIQDIVSMGCDFIDLTNLNLDVLGNGFGEACQFSRLDSDSDEIYFTCLEFFEETGSDECTNGWWTSLLFTGAVDFGPSPDDDGPGTDGGNKPWWFNLLIHEGSDLPYQLDELMNSFGGQLFTYDDITKWMNHAFRLDSSSAEQVCSSALNSIQDDTLTAPVIADNAMDYFIQLVAHASPQLCSEELERAHETTPGSHQFFPSEMPSEVTPADLLGIVFTFLGGYENTLELCQESVQAVQAVQDNPELLDQLVQTMKMSMFGLIEDADSCELFLGVMQSSVGLPVSIGEIVGLESNRQLCESIATAFSPDAMVDIDLSAVLAILSPSDTMSYSDSGTEVTFGELIKVVGKLYNSGSIMDMLSSSCDLIDQANVAPETFGSAVAIGCAWLREDQTLSDTILPMCVAAIGPAFDAETDDGGQLEEWFVSLFSLDAFMSVLQNSLLIDSSSPENFCSRQVGYADDVTATVLRAFDTTLWRYIRQISDAFPQLCGEDGDTKTDEGIRVVRAVFTALGQFADSDELCQTTLTALETEPTDETEEINVLVNRFMGTIYNARRDLQNCEIFLAEIGESLNLPSFVSEQLGAGTDRALCEAVVEAFDSMSTAIPADVEITQFFQLILSVANGEDFPAVTDLSLLELIRTAGHFINAGNIQSAVRESCNVFIDHYASILSVFEFNFNSLCDWARSDSNSDDFYDTCLGWFPTDSPDYPEALRTVDVVQLIRDTVFPLFGIQISGDDYCKGADYVLTSDLTPKQLVVSLMDSWLKIGMDYGAGVCESREEVLNYLLPELTSGSHFAEWRVEERQRVLLTWHSTFDLATELAGFASTDEMCSALIAARGDYNVTNALVDAIRETVLTYLTDEAECTAAVGSLARFINAVDVDSSNMFYQVTGYFSPQALCIVSTAAFRGEADTATETCFGIVDCAGVCNGDAEYDCAGFCLGTSVRDCAGVCNGEATINSCNECVGGLTRRSEDFGKDFCGNCKSDPDYRITWDCAGTCNGSAFVDDCNECVGGETGKPEDYNDFRIDCKGFCDGSWVEDGCGYCEPISGLSFSEGFSKYMDCAGNCFTPGASSDRALLNYCGVCYGGTTGLPESSGTNACGQCESDPNADETSCSGCDGVPNSGQTLDACGVCGGTGTTCFGVGWIVPSVVSDDSNTQLQVYGAGFDEGSTFACIFENSEGAQTSSDAVYVDYVSLQCDVPELASGDYSVKVQKDSFISTAEFSTTLTVLPVIEILSVLPSELTVNSSVENFDVTVTASESAFTAVKSIATPYLIVEGDINIIPTGTFDDESDSIMSFTLPMPSRSIQVTAWPSLNGIERLTASDGQGFPLTAFYPAPEFTEVYFASSGAALVARFSAGVNFNEVTGCADVFADTSKFGANAFCRWVGSTTLYIILGTGSDLAAVGDELALKADSVKAFRETYSLSASGSQSIGGPSTPIVPNVVLLGTPRITSCGTVKLSGRQSQGGAGRDMVYTWSVSSTAGGDTSSLETVLADESKVNLVVPGELLDADTIYTFGLTAENFLGESDTAYFNVSRSSQAVPEVAILAKGVDPTQVYVSDSFDLTAEITFYSDCVPPGETVFSWSVDNDNIPLNLKTINRRSLYVDSNSLPGDSTITFTVTIYKSSEPDNSVSQSFTVQTIYSDLVAIIYGGSELTVGRDSGLFVLDGSGSFDLDEVAVDMSYEWQCSQVTDNTACWSFKSGEGGTQFPTSAAAAMSLLSFDASSMEADKIYEFTLVVSKQTRTASTSVLVTALNGDPPKVDIASITGRVKADKSLSLSASIYHDLPLSSYVWETVGDDLGYSYLDLTDGSNLNSEIGLYSLGTTNGSFTVLSIKSGKLTAGSTYVFQLTAITEDMQYGIAKVQFTVLGEVTSCVFSLDGIDSYNELDSIAYTIENCVGDESAYPLSYRVFLLDESKLQTITEKTNDPSISGVGKPVLGDGASNTFVAEVCDTFKSCAYFYHTVNVTANLQCTAEAVASLTENLVSNEKFKQNYGGALINYNTIQQKCPGTSARRRKRAVSDTSSDEALEQLALVTSVIDNSVLDIDSAQFLIDQCSYINTDDLTVADQSTLIDILVTLLAVFESAGESVPEDSAAIIVNKAIEIRRGLNATHNAATLTSIEDLINSLSQAQVSDLALGAAALETISSALTSSVQRAIPSGAFSSKSSGGNTIDFGTALGDIYNAAWACSSGTCSGVTVNFEHWATGEDDFSVSAEDRANVAADITVIKLRDPSSGDELSITNLSELISITLSVTQPQNGKSYECRYWDTVTSTWATDGMETVIDSSDAAQVECLTDHLTAFTLIAVEGTTAMPTEMDTVYAEDATTFAEATTPGVADATTPEVTDPAVTDPIELPETGDSSLVIIIVVVVAVVVLLLVIIGVVYVLKAKKGIKKNAVDPNGNVPMNDIEEARPVAEEMEMPDDLWATQRPSTPRRSPEPPVQKPTTTVKVVAVPMALETANLESLSPPSSPHLVADMNDVAPPPVYLPPSQNTDTEVPLTQVVS